MLTLIPLISSYFLFASGASLQIHTAACKINGATWKECSGALSILYYSNFMEVDLLPIKI